MIDPIGIQAHALHFGLCPAIVLGGHRVVQEKFGSAFRAVDFDWYYRRRPDQNSVFALFSNNKRSLFDTEAAPQLRWQHYAAAAADFAG